MNRNKSVLYKKIFIINVVLTIILMFFLYIHFSINLIKNSKKSKFYINERIAFSVSEELDNLYYDFLKCVKKLYRDEMTLNDVVRFMNMDMVSYLEHKINKVYSSDDTYYRGIQSFVNESFNLNENLKEVSFVSFARNENVTFDESKKIDVVNLKDFEFTNGKDILNLFKHEGNVSFTGEIKNPINFHKEGLMVLTFDLRFLKDVAQKFNTMINVLVLDENEHVVYDSKGILGHDLCKHYDEIANSENNFLTLEDKYYVNSVIGKGGLKTISIIDFRGKGLVGIMIYFVLSGILFLIVSRGIYRFKIKSLSDRTNSILDAIDKIKNGDLYTEIPLTSDCDEINYIAENLNYMRKNLNEHIDKSFKAESEQKKSEMLALQSQINLHFLYNTLESIRMKAVCNGDKEVGNMIYTLSSLFRKQLKDKNIVTIESELECCKKYIEIFKYRYPDSFQFFIDCDENLKNMQIVKFTVQPLVENYFVHGIRLEDRDNILTIKVTKHEEDIVIKIIDNGKGIDDFKMNLINNRIKTRKYSQRSIGVVNVHERLVIEYGKKYGISLEKTEYGNNVSILKIPCKEC